MKCHWSKPRQCPWPASKRVSIRLGEVEAWGRDCCDGHVGLATRDALERIMAAGKGSLHTARYEASTDVRRRVREPLIRPYLAVTQTLHRRMITAQQGLTPRITMHQLITDAIAVYVDSILRSSEDHE